MSGNVFTADEILGGIKRLATGEHINLVETLAGGKPDRKLLRLADGAAGNPLYITAKQCSELLSADDVLVSMKPLVVQNS